MEHQTNSSSDPQKAGGAPCQSRAYVAADERIAQSRSQMLNTQEQERNKIQRCKEQHQQLTSNQPGSTMLGATEQHNVKITRTSAQNALAESSIHEARGRAELSEHNPPPGFIAPITPFTDGQDPGSVLPLLTTHHCRLDRLLRHFQPEIIRMYHHDLAHNQLRLPQGSPLMLHLKSASPQQPRHIPFHPIGRVFFAFYHLQDRTSQNFQGETTRIPFTSFENAKISPTLIERILTHQSIWHRRPSKMTQLDGGQPTKV